MNFKKLTESILTAHSVLYKQAVKAVNTNLTIRNFIVGYYIVEFEQNGEDRAQYGKQLTLKLSKSIKIKGLTAPELSRCRQFYNTYPQLADIFSNALKNNLPILGTVSQEFDFPILGTLSQEFKNNNAQNNYLIKLLENISFSQFSELIKIDDNTKRKFYELLIIKTNLSVRELRRNIETLTYERFGLSGANSSVFNEIEKKILPTENSDLVKSHYFFDFLNIKQTQIIEENELEQKLINHLQEFIMELGDGFCFEARQKRILIGDEYYFVDLVFYHRILKCHVLIELKTKHAKYEHIGQLNAYLEHYRRKIKQETDNPPVGILLVTGQNKTLIEYAISDKYQDLFVSEYMLQLPSKEVLKSFIESQLTI